MVMNNACMVCKCLRFVTIRGRSLISDTLSQYVVLPLALVPLCRGEAGLLLTPKYGYFRNLLQLVSVVGLFSPLFFLICLCQISLHVCDDQ